MNEPPPSGATSSVPLSIAVAMFSCVVSVAVHMLSVSTSVSVYSPVTLPLRL